MLEIDVDSNSVFRDDRFRHRLAREISDMIVQAFLLAHRAMTALDNRARMKQFAERVDDSLAHPIRARGQKLHDEDITEAIDDHARNPSPSPLTRRYASYRRGRIAPEFERGAQPSRDQFFDSWSLAPCQHA